MDTRNNMYHIFGSKAGGAGKYSDFGKKKEFSYLGKDLYSVADHTLYQDAYQFTTFPASPREVYDKFLGAGGAIESVDMAQETSMANNMFLCQKSTRLAFYIRAFDNINTFNTITPNTFGVKTLKYTLTDGPGAGGVANDPDQLPHNGQEKLYNPGELWGKPPVWQFRAPNCSEPENPPDASDASKKISLEIEAKDVAGNATKMEINFAVSDSNLTIRSLEERRKRSN
jgi:hypothetical protein